MHLSPASSAATLDLQTGTNLHVHPESYRSALRLFVRVVRPELRLYFRPAPHAAFAGMRGRLWRRGARA
ncbi:MAG: hypothetical protein AVDCRST_MAG02-946 [uncultured Rubrobacteraceae bacterium]|uniref:Uncharacterized protein n=1 Tax=uncultured Rubrobacteraceae bacterium TaxID=349277 RepID=A0A6J4QU81_9ACTN|nr:MAG: hypothetical protein AVDCRST_MAG02-946 [uncultured Rubrobacteraceae bacterium]